MGQHNKWCNHEIIFPKTADRLKLKFNVTSNFTTMEREHGNINAYLYRFKIKDNPMCFCKKGEQTIDHILIKCQLVEQERDTLTAAVFGQKTGTLQRYIYKHTL